MTTRNWNGANGSFSDGTQWSPTGVPTSGDTAVISSGTVLAAGLSLAGLTIDLSSNATAGGVLNLTNDTINADTVLNANDPNAYGSGITPFLNIQGTTTNLGKIAFTGSITFLQFSNGSGGGALINNGTISIVDASPILRAATGSTTPTLQNNGSITVSNPDGVFQSPVIGANVSGSGNVNITSTGRIDFSQAVGSGQSINFTGGSGASSVMQIDQVANFAASINGFEVGDSITVTNTPYTNYTYTATGASTGTLSLFSNGTLEGSLNFNGVYSANTLSLSNQALGGGGSNLVITTPVTNSLTGSTSGSTLAVYRFFDTIYGTHLFTQSASEAQSIIAARPDLTEETNNFGAVAQSAPSAEAVYRFFETTNGTHFFTASATEFAGLTTPGSATYRPDLTYEASSTFYEDSTQQSGDVAVFRLFDTAHGTQFLTGSQPEYAGLTTAGSATYRPDLTPEGVAFYAPAGTFLT